jgi:hypothetical protein
LSFPVQVASHPNMQLVVSKVTDWSSGLRFTVASLALRLSTGVLLLSLAIAAHIVEDAFSMGFGHSAY